MHSIFFYFYIIGHPLRLKNFVKIIKNAMSIADKRPRSPTQNKRKSKHFKGCSTPAKNSSGQVTDTPKNSRKKWTKVEDEQLKMLVQLYMNEGRQVEWTTISKQFSGRRRKSFNQRYDLLTKHLTNRRGKWNNYK